MLVLPNHYGKMAVTFLLPFELLWQAQNKKRLTGNAVSLFIQTDWG
tara:strand:- start:12495 stop:12632 length:138 start_codon:yes stop_codon:yes gene_type:complete